MVRLDRNEAEVPLIQRALPCALPPVLAVGAYLKNTLCAFRGNVAFLSETPRTLSDRAAREAFAQEAQEFLRAYAPRYIAHDLHPDFPSTLWAEANGPSCDIPCLPIQHHHAHIAALMAEKNITAPVLGLALDGYGMGTDGGAWGGELMRVDSRGFRRLGHLYSLLQPGGDKAARAPWRMGAAALWSLGRSDEIASRFSAFPGAVLLDALMTANFNSPPTSSAGRLFDAACGLLGVKPIAAFEGEAPMALEALAEENIVDSQGWTLSGDPLILDFRPLLSALCDCTPEKGAALFHGTLIAGLIAWAQRARDRTGISTLLCAGGCFLNKRLVAGLRDQAESAGLNVVFHEALSPGDASLSLGQAYAAALAME